MLAPYVCGKLPLGALLSALSPPLLHGIGDTLAAFGGELTLPRACGFYSSPGTSWTLASGL